MLLAFACLARDLFLTLKFIKNDRLAFAMEWTLYVILFVVGQLFVYLMFQRIYRTEDETRISRRAEGAGEF